MHIGDTSSRGKPEIVSEDPTRMLLRKSTFPRLLPKVSSWKNVIIQRLCWIDAMCHCMSEEEYEAMLKRIREASKKTVQEPAVITVKA